MAKVSDNILVRVYWLFAMFLLFGILILFRVSSLQLNKAEWTRMEVEKKVFFKKVIADRGNILAEDGTILATSLPFYQIGMDPSVIDTTYFENFTDSLSILSNKLIDYFEGGQRDSTDSLGLKHYHRVMGALAKGRQYVGLIRKPINYQQLQMIKEWPILNAGRLKGGFVVDKIHNKRFFPFEKMGRITLGLLKDDTLGIRGIEYSYNKELRGKDGFFLAQKIAGGSYIPLDKYGSEDAVDGKDIVTTLDVNLQDIVETSVKKAVEKHEAKFGTAILIEVNTGKIKAIANYPEEYNHAIATQIEPGSTFKLASAVALLDKGVVKATDTIDTGQGFIEFDDKKIRDDFAYGKIPFSTVLAKSSNVGISKTVNHYFKDSINQFYTYLDNFGFKGPINSQIDGEPAPKIIRKKDEGWNLATLPSMSIGYSLNVTPLQMAAFYNAIANDGRLMQPYLVKEIRDNSKVIQSYSPVVLNKQVCKKETAQKVKELLRGVVDFGTAKNIKDSRVLLAGKTGTARKIVDGEYQQIHQASFAGFFPADNPRYTCYVLIDEPSAGEIYGSQVAAPIFKEIAEQVYAMDVNLSEEPKLDSGKTVETPLLYVMSRASAEQVYRGLGEELGTLEGNKWVHVARDTGNQVILAPCEPQPNRIPDVRGMSAREALVLLERMGVLVRLKGHGHVKRQSLLPGYKIGKRTTITLFLG